ncbi:MAG: hypothetical protein ACRDE2_13150, partial [Chitinophagaceae bacterium]
MTVEGEIVSSTYMSYSKVILLTKKIGDLIMNDKTNDEATVALVNKATAVSTVGYFCIAITFWMTGMLTAGWFTPATVPGIETGTLYSVGSILLVIIGILSLVFGKRVLDSIIFLATGVLIFALFRG